MDSAAVRPDTAKPKPDQVYHTDHGRVVLGGGGIIPDVVVRPDSALESVVRMLNAALGRNVPKYNDALAAYALDARARHAVSSPTFELTPEMRAAFLALLARRGVTLDPRTVAATQGFLDQQLGYEIAQFSFGRSWGIRRLFEVDPVLQQAQTFASKARTPADLLALAQSAAQAAPAQRP